MNKTKNPAKISILVIFLTIFASSLFPWQKGESKEDIVWKEKEYPNGFSLKIEKLGVNIKISRVYSFGNCKIYLHEEGNGITIVANDLKWNDIHLVQFVTIRKKAEKKEANFICRYLKIVEKNGERRYYYPLVEGYYDIFYNKYRDIAKELPLEIKEKFQGYFGISK